MKHEDFTTIIDVDSKVLRDFARHRASIIATVIGFAAGCVVVGASSWYGISADPEPPEPEPFEHQPVASEPPTISTLGRAAKTEPRRWRRISDPREAMGSPPSLEDRDELARRERESNLAAIERADEVFYKRDENPNGAAEQRFRENVEAGEWGAEIRKIECLGRACRAEVKFPGRSEYEDFFETFAQLSKRLDVGFRDLSTMEVVVYQQDRLTEEEFEEEHQREQALKPQSQ